MNVVFRQATINDLPEIVRMLADDHLGAQREKFSDPLPEGYTKAFVEIEASEYNELIVAEMDGAVVGSMQLTVIPGISHQGAKRMIVESVRVDAKLRNRGIGQKMIEWAIAHAREKGCFVIQLTTHNGRKDAQRFYERLGFEGSHLGMKLKL